MRSRSLTTTIENLWMPDLILGFPDSRVQARRIAADLNASYSDVEVHRFPDGESLVQVHTEVPVDGKTIALFRSLDQPNGKIIELLLTASVLASASSLSLIAPYLPYMRQDKAFHDGEAVSQRVIANLLGSRFDRIATVDPHLHRTHDLDELFNCRPVISLSAAEAMADYLRHRFPDETVIMGPDEESAPLAGAVGVRSGREWAVARKRRIGDREVEISLPDGISIADRPVVIVDDMISSGHTICTLARKLYDAGASIVDACVTHALYGGDDEAMLNAAGVRWIASSDSVAHDSNSFSIIGYLASELRSPS